MRGVVDIYVAAVSVPAAALLVASARPGAATLAAAIYGASLVVLLVGSAVYHLPLWSLRTALWLRKVDHANIYLLIAGTCTPLALSLADGGAWLLTSMWVAAALGILKTFLWPYAPRRLSSALYVAMGALTMPCAPVLYTSASTAFYLFTGGGALYIVGAVIYALRWPSPAPLVFGYHEVFHLFVIGAAALHFAAVAMFAL